MHSLIRSLYAIIIETVKEGGEKTSKTRTKTAKVDDATDFERGTERAKSLEGCKGKYGKQVSGWREASGGPRGTAIDKAPEGYWAYHSVLKSGSSIARSIFDKRVEDDIGEWKKTGAFREGDFGDIVDSLSLQ